MSMRLVKQQLAALSSKSVVGNAGVEKAKSTKEGPKQRNRKRKKGSSLADRHKKKESAVALTEEDIKKANLEQLKKLQPAEKSVELMSKVHLPIRLITVRIAIQCNCRWQ